MPGYANFTVSEDSTSAETTVTFPWKARHIVITNDSGSKDLEFKFQSGQDFATLKPTETISLYLHSQTVVLNSPSAATVSYRVWAWG